jgi:hypothetical protein
MENAILKLFENKPANRHGDADQQDVLESVDHVIEAMDAVIEISNRIVAVPVGRRPIASSRWLH